MYLGNKVFISYRGHHFSTAQELKKWLEDNKYCDYAILYPPNTICTSDELLLPYDFFELLGKLRDGYLAGFGTYADISIDEADAFVYLETDDYWKSLFTQAEVMLWRCKSAEIYPAKLDGRRFFSIGKKECLPPLSGIEQELRLTAYRTSRYTKKAPLDIGTYYWGKYAKNSFLIGCPACKEYFLVSTNAVYEALKVKFDIACPHCNNNRFYFEESSKQGHFYRNPIRIHHLIPGKPRILRIDEMMKLLQDNDLPSSIRLVSLPGETLKSDGRKVAEAYGMAGLALVGLALIGSLFNKDE